MEIGKCETIWSDNLTNLTYNFEVLNKLQKGKWDTTWLDNLGYELGLQMGKLDTTRLDDF